MQGYKISNFTWAGKVAGTNENNAIFWERNSNQIENQPEAPSIYQLI